VSMHNHTQCKTYTDLGAPYMWSGHVYMSMSVGFPEGMCAESGGGVAGSANLRAA